jgi:hypothetical protein
MHGFGIGTMCDPSIAQVLIVQSRNKFTIDHAEKSVICKFIVS